METIKKIVQLYQEINGSMSKKQIIEEIYQYKLQPYPKLLDLAKQKLEVLSWHRNIFKRGLSGYYHVGITKSVQELMVLLIMKKYSYTDTSQINYGDIRSVMNDLIGLKIDKNTIKYDLDDTPKYNYLHQIINVVVDKNRDFPSTECIIDGIKRYNTRNPKKSSHGFRKINNSAQRTVEHILKVNLKNIPEQQTELNLDRALEFSINVKDINKSEKIFCLLRVLGMLGVYEVKSFKNFHRLESILSQPPENQGFAKLQRAFDDAFVRNYKSQTKIAFKGDVLSGDPKDDLLMLNFFYYLNNIGICYEFEDHDDVLNQFIRQIRLPENLDKRLKVELISQFYQVNFQHEVLNGEVLLEDNVEFLEDTNFRYQFVNVEVEVAIAEEASFASKGNLPTKSPASFCPSNSHGALKCWVKV